MPLSPERICHLISIGFREGDGMEKRAFSAKEGWPVLGCQVWEAGTVEKKKKDSPPPLPGTGRQNIEG